MNSIWFAVIAIVLITLQSKIYKRYVFKNLIVERKFSDIAVFPGETTNFKFTITSNKLLPVTWLRIEQKFPSKLRFEGVESPNCFDDIKYIRTMTISILPFQKVTRKYKIKCTERGLFEMVDEIRLISTNLLGTEEYTNEMTISPVLIAVYPNIKDIRSSLIPSSTMQGDVFVKRWIMEDPMVVAGIRDYSTSDSLRNINWKATAKSSKILVNKYDYTADKKIMILFSLGVEERLHNINGFKDIEKLIEALASMSVMLVKQGMPVGFAADALIMPQAGFRIIEPNTGEAHISALLEAFAGITYYKQCQFNEVLDIAMKYIDWGTEIIIFAPFISDDLMLGLETLNDIKTTVICKTNSNNFELPNNVSLFTYSEEGEQIEMA